MGLFGMLFDRTARNAGASQARGHLRHPLADEATLTIFDTADVAVVQIVDLSVAGARVRGSLDLSAGDAVALTLRVADNVELQLSARVAHVAPSSDRTQVAEFGLAFNSAHFADRKLVARYIRQRAIDTLLEQNVPVGAGAD
ncbi:MAG TPA: PilZ domain-containing protein [Candidatus Eremiobacteraceae bacterium]|nr:PilZ domain-containing protein [Candidatus Eremiobacteraceae bacterium]